MFKFLERIEGAANVGRIVVLVFFMAFVVHIISCVWFWVASPNGGYLDVTVFSLASHGVGTESCNAISPSPT